VSTAPKNPPPAESERPKAEPEAEEARGGRKERPEKEAPGAKPARDGKAGEGKAEGKPKGKGGKAAPGAPGAKKAKPIPDNPDFRYIVRVAGSDLDGRRSTALALTGVRGIGLRMATVACRMANVRAEEMIGNLPEATVEGIEATLSGLAQNLPPWMLNHRADTLTDEVHHFVGADLETARRDDVNRMKMIRSYRGVRHERGQKVRGQRTRSNGRTGMAAGVLKKAAKEAAAAKGKEEAAPAAPAAAEKTAAPAKAAPAAAAKAAAPAKPAAAAKPAEKKA
jgi:small subunit ribosomal protein S13